MDKRFRSHRLQRRSRGGEKSDDFFAGFRVALGSREEQLEKDLNVAEETTTRMHQELAEVRGERDHLRQQLTAIQGEVVLKPSEEATQAQTQEASSPSPPKRRGEEDLGMGPPIKSWGNRWKSKNWMN
eukprot:s203_g51.t2